MRDDRITDPRKLDTPSLLRSALSGERRAALELATRLARTFDAGRGGGLGSDSSVPRHASDRKGSILEALVEFVPRIEARSSTVLRDYWAVVVANTLQRAPDRLLANRREVMIRRPLGDAVSVLLDPPNIAVTSVSRVTSKGDEYARVRALLPLLDPVDEEVFIRRKLLEEGSDRIARDLGQESKWVDERASRAYARLFSLINKTREGRLAEILRERVGDASRSPDLVDPGAGRGGSSGADSGSRSFTPPVAAR